MARHHEDKNKAGFHKQLLLCTALALSPAALCGPALAQDSDEAAAADEDDVIVVRGIRRSVEDSVAAKRESTSIIEAVSAEDIGKLPDASIAEAIGRLPGVAAQRDKGRAQTLSIRGLGPSFTVTTLNGREQASTNDNRSVEYDQYPSEMIQQVRVYKTPDARMTYQGLAGTADLMTVRPLSYNDRSLQLTAKFERNELDSIVGADTEGQRYNLSYVDQFLDNTLGVALGISHTDAPYQARTHEPWGYPNCGGQCAAGDENLVVIGGDKSGVQSSNYERNSIMGVLQVRPNDQFEVVVDIFHSDFEEVQTIRRLEYGTIWGTGTLQPGYTVSDGRITSGQFNGVTTIVENYANDRDATVDNFGVNVKYSSPDDRWLLEADLSNSRVERTDLRLESTAGTGPSGSVVRDNLGFEVVGDGVTQLSSSLNYGDFNSVFLTDPGGWGSPLNRAGYLGNPTVDDEISAIRLSARRNFEGPISSVTFGVNYAERDKEKVQWQGELRNPDAPAQIVPEAYRNGVIDSSFWGNPNGLISYDALGLYHSGFWNVTNALVDPSANTGDRTFVVTQSWLMQEKLTTLFLMAELDTSLFSLPLTGNFGIQSVGVEQESRQGFTDGSSVPGNPAQLNVTQVRLGDDYSDVLPSTNLILHLTDNTALRFGAARVQARPRMDDMAGGQSYSVAVDNGAPFTNGNIEYYWNSGGGNPMLRPWKADAYDLSLEHYFTSSAYVSAAAFYKDLKSYVFNQLVPVDFSGVPLPTPTANYTEADANRMGYSSSPTNGEGGYVKGVELSATIPGELLLPALEGFGLIFSTTFNDSEIKPDGTNAVPLPGLSERVTNTTLYFERWGFSARVSMRDRSEWLGEVPNFDSSLGSQWVDAEQVVDAQIGYNFNDGALNGLSVNLSAYNLTDEPFRYYAGEGQTQNILKYENYGTTYLLSVGYRFF